MTSRDSAWKGTWRPNKRPFVTVAPDAYVSIQGETTVIGCGECRREININDYVTSISTEATVDSPPGSATVQLTIPDNDINQFYVDGQLIIIPMMEMEIYAKGYFLVGGFPQYYKIFWGIVSSVSKSWSNGTTTVNISCKDILRWWELTIAVINPAFLNQSGTSAGGYQLFQNQFAGMNPYTIIIQLAKEAMGDFAQTVGSFTSFTPEFGAEGAVAGTYLKDVMLYWQLKFGRIWNSLVMYGTSGQIYTTQGFGGTINAVSMSKLIFDQEWQYTKDEAEVNSVLKLSPAEIAAYKVEVSKAGDVEFFQNESATKMSIANQAKEQISYELFMDPCGDIVFKPPFYNMNVLPNKPVSWIQDFEVIDDSITDSEAEVYTHITSSGNAFGGVTDFGLNDEITTPRTGVYDYHLLRRYGWRTFAYSCEWAGNPRKLFYHLMDMLDRLNAKRQNGTVTIPMRPELRLGFPIWFPKYDSFFYVQGISHSYSVGGQANTTLTLIAKRSKFIAPNNIGAIEVSGKRTVETTQVPDQKYVGKPTGKKNTPKKKVPLTKGKKVVKSYKITFPDAAGDTTGQSNLVSQGKPVILRDPRTGKLLGYPNVVMVYRSSLSGQKLAEILESIAQPADAAKNKTQKAQSGNASANYGQTFQNAFKLMASGNKDAIIARIRLHRYEAGMTNAGAYDYAHDVSRDFKEFQIIPVESVEWGAGLGPNVKGKASTITGSPGEAKESEAALKKQEAVIQETLKGFRSARSAAEKAVSDAQKKLSEAIKKDGAAFQKKGALLAAIKQAVDTTFGTVAPESDKARIVLTAAQKHLAELQAQSFVLAADIKSIRARAAGFGSKVVPELNIIVRPVSDEFGFEVTGHYKYGRGAFIDRGKLQLPGTNDVTGKWNGPINQINIQFSPTGGVLTEGVETSEASSIEFSEAFEKMRPDDWATGAHFRGTSANGTDVPQDFHITSVNTYSSDIKQRVGRSVFVEADSTRRATTLLEMKPTLSIDMLSSSIDSCNCGMGHSDWLSILPVSVIQQILDEAGKTTSEGSGQSGNLVGRGSGDQAFSRTATGLIVAKDDNYSSPDKVKEVKVQKAAPLTGFPTAADALGKDIFAGTPLDTRPSFSPPLPNNPEVPITNKEGDSRSIISGGLDTGTFFGRLSKFLNESFNKSLQENNRREEAYSGQSLGKVNIFDVDIGDQDNILTPPGGALFDRAAQGDPVALAALQNQANFNFGLTKNAASELKKQYKSGENLGESLSQFARESGAVFKPNKSNILNPLGAKNVTTGDPKKQGQPLPKPPVPDFNSILNPGRFGSAGAYQNPSPLDPDTKFPIPDVPPVRPSG